MLPNRCHFHLKMPENGLVMRFSLRNLSFPLDFRFFNHRDFHCFFVILLSTFFIFHRGDSIFESFCTQNVLTKLFFSPTFNNFLKCNINPIFIPFVIYIDIARTWHRIWHTHFDNSRKWNCISDHQAFACCQSRKSIN